MADRWELSYVFFPGVMLGVALDVMILMALRVVGNVPHRIFCLAPSVLHLTLYFLSSALHLRFLITSPFANLALCPSGDFICFTLHAILIHDIAFLALGP